MISDREGEISTSSRFQCSGRLTSVFPLLNISELFGTDPLMTSNELFNMLTLLSRSGLH